MEESAALVAARNARTGRQERALTLSCQGMRPAAIAAELGVSASTVRRWLRVMLQTLAEEEQEERAGQLLRAIESQRAIAAAAWRSYEREQAAAEDGERGASAGQGARYLSVALAAQREIARLQGLYSRLAPTTGEVHITLTRRPDGPENAPPLEASLEASQGMGGAVRAIEAAHANVTPGEGSANDEP